ncbi:MAG: 50S ribosomal protein L31 [Mycoplasmatales bacterium]
MKKEIHMNYIATKTKCTSCGSEFEINSTMENLNLEACNKCHPAYTGKAKTGKAAGRVERFNKKYGL